MRARDYFYYIPYMVMGFVIAVPSLSWFDQLFGNEQRAAGISLAWGAILFCAAFFLLSLAQGRGVFLPLGPDRRGKWGIFGRLVGATGFAIAIYAVAQRGLSGVGTITIIILAVVPVLFLLDLYGEHQKRSASRDGRSDPA